MKYLSIIFFLVLMKFTWGMAYKAPVVSIETHKLIQTELKDIIYQVLVQYRPTATNLKFQTIWTERLSDHQLKAHFTYSFVDSDDQDGESVEQTQDGEVILNQIPPSDGDQMDQNGQKSQKSQKSWSLDEVTVLRQALHFKKGIVISPAEK
ncbi:MAG: hypothetical protein SGJ18_01765 [Pseudomonadota bacterium]|nr:hypothetical protein [Pseudomonadota bacterium]